MSYAHRSLPPERNDDDAARVHAARSEAIAATVNALRQVSLPPAERALVVVVARSMATHPLNPREMHRVMQVAWRHRRKLPPHLAPKINPDDPLCPDRLVPPSWKDRPDA